MKRLALLVSLALLTVVGTTATTQAYYLDTPHNESNGIYCYTCHSMSYWTTPPTGGIDVTMRNAVCLQCHAEGATDPKKGPAKKLHATSTTSDKFGTWTTECTQCHDVHSQGQLDWATTEPDVYLATGNLAGTGTWLAKDLVYSPNYGSTTFTISNVTGQAGWTDTATWTSKGGMIDSTRAADASRGLIFVPNTANPNECYEIIYASATSIKVKGQVKTVLPANTVFGIIYGQSLKSAVLPNGGTTAADMRNVVFFKPAVIAGTYGGFVDDTAASTKPVGICQVCHTAPAMVWKTDGTVRNHNADKTCSECHNGPKGFPPSADHSTFIADRLGSGCGTCHSTKITNPDTAHTSCSVCHGAAPVLNTNAMLNDGGTVLANLQSKGYSGGTTGVRITYAGKLISDPTFQKIDCGDCHLLKPAAVAGGTHGGHGAGAFAWDGNCNECHSGARIAQDVHNTAVNGCTICHSTPTGGTRVDGSAANGVDGDARLGIATSACSVCHTAVNTSGTIHHVSKNNYATSGNCAFCHKASTTGGSVVGNRAGNHTALVATDTNCVSCHAATVGSASGAPVDGSVVVNKIHDTCVSCHNTDGTLKTQAQVGGTKVIAMPNGGAGSNNGGGNCTACHGTYFPNHTNANHVTRVGDATACTGCHNATKGTATTVPLSAAQDKVHDTCSSCHETTGLLKAAFGVAQAMPAGGGICTVCHTTGFTALHPAIDHSAKVSDSASCNVCHLATKGTATGIPVDTTAHTKVHDACTTCHDAATGALKVAYGKAGAMPAGGGSCTACHTATSFTLLHDWATVDHSFKVTDTASCATCHTATKGTGTGIPVDATPNTKVHDACTTCHSDTSLAVLKTAYGKAGAMAPGACAACHTATWSALHTYVPDHSTLVSNTANCSSCHTAVGATVDPVDTAGATGRAGRMVHDACTTCHDAATGVLVGSAAGHAGGGNCSTCHSTFVFANHSNADHVALVGDAAACTGCHNATKGTTTTVPLNAANDKVHDTCASCHETNGVLKAAFGVAQAMPAGAAGSNNGGGTCTACHTLGFTTQHAAAPGPHTTQVSNIATCSSCHTAVGATVDPVDTAGATGRAGRMVHDACTTCHDATTGALVGSASGHAGGGNCSICHSTFVFANHSNADHVALVGDTAACTVCHNATKGTTTTVPLSAANDKVHDTCASCHDVNGVLRTAFGVAQAMPAGAAGSNNGGGTCTACHTAGFTTSHAALAGTHSTQVSNIATCSSCHTAVGATVDPVDTAGATGRAGRMVHDACATCHDASTGALVGSASGHAGGGNCSICHSTFVFANHSNADHVALVGDTAACTGCHNATKGTTTTVPLSAANDKVHDTCASCHDVNGVLRTAFGVAQAMPAGAAGSNNGGGTCTACHTATFNTSHAALAGTHSTQVSNIATCSSCHTAVGATVDPVDTAGATGRAGRMVHDACTTCHDTNTGVLVGSAAGHAGGGNCSICHSTFVFANHSNADHVALVGDAPTCTTASCHNATKGTTTTVPLSAANDKVHDTCASCHDVNGVLRTAFGVAQAMPAGAAGSNNGGGICTVCHTAGFTTAHAALAGTHATQVSNTANCSGCHTAVGATVDPVDTAGATGRAGRMVHDACATCHDATTGALVGSAAGHTGGGNCSICHSTFVFANHSNADHVALVADSASCNTAGCHTATKGTTTTVPTDGTLHTRVHDTCATCHTATGALAAPTGSAAAMPAGAAGSNNGGGACTLCHTTFTLSNHNHTHLVTYVAGTDIGNNPGAACGTCHIPTVAGNLNSWAGIYEEHLSNCGTCHSYTNGDGLNSPPLATSNSLIQNSTASTCITCHTEKVPAQPAHGGHTATDFAANAAMVTSCGTASCHNFTTSTDIAKVVHGNGTAATCGLCHIKTAGGGTRRVTANSDATVGTKTSICDNCHLVGGRVKGGIHHDTATAASNGCVTCHPVAIHTTQIATNASCDTAGCHVGANSPAGTATTAPVSLTNAMVHDACRTCHVFNATTLAGELRPATNNKGVTAMPITGTCVSCHTASKAIIHHGNVNVTNGACTFCHDDPRNDAIGTLNANDGNYEETVGAKPTVQMHCDECHVSPILNATGWTAGGNMTISAWNEGGTHSTTNHSTDFTRTIANSGGHVIPNTAGVIDNWGICFSCHNGALAGGAVSSIKPFHPAPTGVGACNATFEVGNGVTGSVSRTFYLGGSWRPSATNTTSGTGATAATNCGDTVTTWVTAGVIQNGTRGAISSVLVPDPWGAVANLYVPVWSSAITAPTQVATPNTVTITGTSAVLSGGTLTVQATTSAPGSCANLTLVNGKGNVAFNGSCIATVAAYAYPGNGTTVDIVDNTLSDEIQALDYPITDNSAAAPAAAVNDAIAASAGNGDVTNLNVLVNDTGKGITITTLTQPAQGTVALAANGYTINYTGNGTAGSPTFNYTIMAGDGTTSTATVTLTTTLPAVTVLDAWSSISATAPAATSGTVTPAAFAVSGSLGTKRVMVVAVSMYAGATITTPSISATYGGVALTPITTGANTRDYVWLGYLKDADIGTGSKSLAVNFSSGVSITSMHIWKAAYLGVNQTTPILASNGNGAAAITVATNAIVNYANRGMTMGITANGGTGSTGNPITATPTLTPGTVTNNVHKSVTFGSAQHTSASSYASGGISVTWTAGSTRSALAVGSLQP